MLYEVITIQIASDTDVAVLARGGGTSQCGQTIGNGIVADVSKYLNGVLELDIERQRVRVQPGIVITSYSIHYTKLYELDIERQRVRVQPGIVLDQLNALLKPHGLFFPIDPSTASRATIGGMAGNNSCGARSIRYGNTVHNVRAIDAIMANGESWHFGEVPADLAQLDGEPVYRQLVQRFVITSYSIHYTKL